MELGAFIPITTIPKETKGNKSQTLNEKYLYYQSIEEIYQEVEKFLDAPIHQKTIETKKLEEERRKAVEIIALINAKENNEMSEKDEMDLEKNWEIRREKNVEMNKVMKALPLNLPFYHRIRKIVERLRKIHKSIQKQGYIARVFRTYLKEIEATKKELYQLEGNGNKGKIVTLLTELDIQTHRVKRLSLVTEQVAPFWEGMENVDRKERRASQLFMKIAQIQMESLLGEGDILLLSEYVDIFREIPSWDLKADLANPERVLIDEERKMNGIDESIVVKLSENFHNPVKRYFMEDELILFGDDRILSDVLSAEDRVELAKWPNLSHERPNTMELVEFLRQHTNGISNCNLDVNENGDYLLYAVIDIERGETLKSGMTADAFLKWIGWNPPPLLSPTRDIEGEPAQRDERGRILTKIALLQGKQSLLMKGDLDRIDLEARITFLRRLIPQKKLILSDSFSP